MFLTASVLLLDLTAPSTKQSWTRRSDTIGLLRQNPVFSCQSSCQSSERLAINTDGKDNMFKVGQSYLAACSKGEEPRRCRASLARKLH
ncbi:uncharacterized protein VDAG_05961 [Verticillium dahliae VdLs.17]|uniref:Secreted protein n=1 Tax=Verticillium dahliae (strain VdLs.17 / ATCC MYA-4575 / FGSC 10137) TaxID=498257 RepID=G2X820_VERDV|nr:uncharacterized protein VDAG_05961 [Verticillium dahliae VdLs.17]EGY15107.1 hypothetical protein VDAG_05961 [Verticillium dahliae VdLs.17]